MTFFLKAGKSGHNHLKDYRPINLTALLNNMEKLVDQRIRESTSFNRLCKAQHTYCKGRSVDTTNPTMEKNAQLKKTYQNTKNGMHIGCN